MNNENDMEIINALKVSIPYLRQLTKDDLVISIFINGICDSCFCDPDSGAGVQPGFDMSHDPTLIEVTRTGKAMHNVIPREVFGRSIEGEVIPIKNNKNEVIAVVTSGYDTEKNFQVESSSSALAGSLGQINESISHIADGSMNLTELLGKIQSFSQEVTKEIQNITNVVDMIQKSAGQSNILALNASIEAARAGDAGRGFSVVASEMGKFSKSNSESAKLISDKLTKMSEYIGLLSNHVNNANEISSTQSAEVEDITASIEVISRKAEELNELAKS